MTLQQVSRRGAQRVRARRAAGWLAAVALLAGAGCKRDEVAHFRVPKEAGGGGALAGGPTMPPMGGGMGGAPMGGGMGGGEVDAPPAPAGALTWTLPKGWTESRQGGMRYATFKPPVEGRIDASVVVLPGPAGGELANVNRWRGQIGLPNLAEGDLAAARKLIQTKAGPVAVYDFTSDGQKKSRVVAGLATIEGSTWFVKLTGDERAVTTVRTDFLRLLESLRREETAAR